MRNAQIEAVKDKVSLQQSEWKEKMERAGDTRVALEERVRELTKEKEEEEGRLQESQRALKTEREMIRKVEAERDEAKKERDKVEHDCKQVLLEKERLERGREAAVREREEAVKQAAALKNELELAAERHAEAETQMHSRMEAAQQQADAGQEALVQVQERDSQVVGLRKRLAEVEAGNALRISTLEGQLKEQSSRMRAVEQEMNMLAHVESDAKRRSPRPRRRLSSYAGVARVARRLYLRSTSDYHVLTSRLRWFCGVSPGVLVCVSPPTPSHTRSLPQQG